MTPGGRDIGEDELRDLLSVSTPETVSAACTAVERVLDHDPARADRLAGLVLSRLADTDPLAVQVRVLRTASRTAYRVGAYDRAAQHGERLVRLGALAADPCALGWGRACLAYVEYEHGRYSHALDLCLQALASLRECESEQDGVARMLVLAGATHSRLDMHRTGLGLFREALEIFRLLGDETWVQRLAGNIAIAFRTIGEYEAALDALAGCDPDDHGIFLDEVRGQLALTAGRLPEAQALFRRSLSANVLPDGGVRKPEQYLGASVGLARTLLHQGHAVDAAALLREPLQRATALDVPAHLSRLHGVLAEIHAEMGDYRSAYRHAVEQRTAAERLHDSRMLDSVQTIRVEHAVAATRAEADRLRELTRRDALTDLPNRRAVDDRLARSMEDPAGPPTVAIVDVDCFKEINDRHSHIVGDQVLQIIALLLRAAFDEQHLVARLGGDEFLIVFDGVPAHRAVSLCQAARRRVAAYPWGQIAADLTVTISVGTAQAVPGRQLGDMVGVADRRLLDAKRSGRNRVAS